MKLNKRQYSGIIESYANEATGIMEKRAEGNTLGNFILGKRDLSNESDQKTKFWKDRIGGDIPASAVSYAATSPFRKNLTTLQNAIGVNMATGNQAATRSLLKKNAPLLIGANLLGSGAYAGINYGRGKNLAKSNDVAFTGGDLAKATFIPYITPDSIIKKKLRNRSAQGIVEKAAELLVGAVICKEACYQNAENAELYAEASEVALNNLGYSL